ncbi:MAG: lipase [Rickettsiaceae bacterium]|jgi:esterase/lipase|nr:lipase [Rickettsiaceae bacterium]
MNQSALKGDYVIILHGIARSSNHMKKLANRIEEAGFDVINLDYPSTSHNIENLTDFIQAEISKKVTEDKKIHFIGYSMGGLMVRALLHKYNYKNLGRVIQLAPPNQGSEIANFLKNFWPYKKIYGPAGQQLITDQTTIKNLFGKINYELGIIAGNVSIDPICWAIIPGKNDGKVSVESTKLEGMKDHITVRASHTLFPSNKEVQKQVIYFLKNGEFQR